ncbi:MAG TPA: hypothetical protein V6C90_09885 [Coleofasciculaceae cyanobacterium]|jgi:hypothetical protein
MIVQERPKTSALHISASSTLNQALWLKKHSSDLKRDQLLFYYLMARQILNAILKDVANYRWTFPQARRLLLIAVKYPSQYFDLYRQYRRLPCVCSTFD